MFSLLGLLVWCSGLVVGGVLLVRSRLRSLALARSSRLQAFMASQVRS